MQQKPSVEFGFTKPDMPKLIDVDIQLKDGRVVTVKVPENPTPEMIQMAASNVAPQKTERQMGAEDLGGLLGSMAALIPAVKYGKLAATGASLLGGALGGGAGAYMTGSDPAMAALTQGLLGVPGEAVAMMKAPVGAIGRKLDMHALNPSQTVLNDVRVPARPHATNAEKRDFLYDAARKLDPPVGTFGMPGSTRRNRDAREKLSAQLTQTVQASPNRVNIGKIADDAAKFSQSQGSGAGNYDAMRGSIDRVITGMKADPLLGHDVPQMAPVNTHPLAQNMEQWQRLPAELQAALQKEGFGAPGTERQVGTVRDFRPDISTSDALKVKQQTDSDIAQFYRDNRSSADPNAVTMQKSVVHGLRDELGQIPGVQPLNEEMAVRIPLQQALEDAVTKTTQKPTRSELFGLLGAATTPFLGQGMVAPLGTAMLLERPALSSNLGRAAMAGSKALPAAGRAGVSPLMRLVHFLSEHPESR